MPRPSRLPHEPRVVVLAEVADEARHVVRARPLNAPDRRWSWFEKSTSGVEQSPPQRAGDGRLYAQVELPEWIARREGFLS